MNYQILTGSAATLGTTKAAGGTITATPAELPQMVQGAMLTNFSVSTTFDANGLFSLQLAQTAKVKIVAKDASANTFYTGIIHLTDDAALNISAYLADVPPAILLNSYITAEQSALAAQTSAEAAAAAAAGVIAAVTETAAAIEASILAGTGMSDEINAAVVAAQATIDAGAVVAGSADAAAASALAAASSASDANNSAIAALASAGSMSASVLAAAGHATAADNSAIAAAASAQTATTKADSATASAYNASVSAGTAATRANEAAASALAASGSATSASGSASSATASAAAAAQSLVDINSGLAGKAPLASPVFTSSVGITGTLAVSSTSVFTGAIGLLGTAANANYGLNMVKSYSDPAGTTMGIRVQSSITWTGAETVSEYHIASELYAGVIVGTNHNNTGYVYGLSAWGIRNNNAAGSDDNGTLSTLYGISCTYGHLNTNASATPQTGVAIGLYIFPYRKTGTITSMYDIYLAADSTGGTVTNRWGIYQVTANNNALNGKLRVGGVTAPSSTLDVTGTFAASSGATALSAQLISTDTTAYTHNAANSSVNRLLVNGGAANLIRFSSGGKHEVFIGSTTETGTVADQAAFVIQGYTGSAYLERARFCANGNVLIGTTTDAATGKLQVTGNTALTGTLTVSSTSVFTGSMGLLGTAIDSKTGVYINKAYTDPTVDSISVNFTTYPTYTGAESVVENFTAHKIAVCPIVNAGHTNGGHSYGLQLVSFRNANAAGSDDDGTLDYLEGISILYGNYNTNAGASPLTTTAYGLSINPYYRAGTITNMYDLYFGADTTGGTVTNRWGIYQVNSANNALGGKLRVGGITAPVATVDVTGNILATTSILSSGGGIGYTTGAGGAVAQATSKATGVTLNEHCGTITLHNATLAANTTVGFTFTNSNIAATDIVVLVHDSVGTLGAYGFAVTPATGSATVSVRNLTAGGLSEAIVLRFAIIKGVVA